MSLRAENSGQRGISRATLGTLCVAAAAMGWGCWSLFLRGAGLHPSWQAVLILVVISLASLPWALAQTLARRRVPGEKRAQRLWWLLCALGLIDSGNYVFFFSAIDRGPISVAVLAHYLAPVLVAALAPLLLREPLARRTPFALGASVLGLSLLLLGAGMGSGDARLALLLGGASAFFYAGGTLLGKRLLESFSSAELLSYHSMVAALVLCALALWQTGRPPQLALFLWRPLIGALLLGCAAGAAYYLGLVRIPAQRAAILTYLEPLVAALVGTLVWGERLGALGAIGGALILVGGAAVALAGDATS